MKYLKNYLSSMFGLALVSACVLSSAVAADPTNSTAAPPAKADDPEVAVITTTDGVMVVQFWTDAAPKTVANFKKLAKADFYNGTCFHRIIKGFMVQGGDPNTKDPTKEAMYGGGGPGWSIPDEKNDHHHMRGTIAMANAGPNTAGSQFYICLAPQPGLDQADYTTFGQLIKGDDVLEKIGNTPVRRSSRGEPSAPTERVEVVNVKIVPLSTVK